MIYINKTKTTFINVNYYKYILLVVTNINIILTTRSNMLIK